MTFATALDDRGDAFIAVIGVPAGSSAAPSGAYVIERQEGGGFSQPALLFDRQEHVRTSLYPGSAEPGPFAVDGQGDVALAWDGAPSDAPGTVQIRAAVREHGQWLPTQTIWPEPPAQAQAFGMGTFVSARWGPAGQLGVAWIG